MKEFRFISDRVEIRLFRDQTVKSRVENQGPAEVIHGLAFVAEQRIITGDMKVKQRVIRFEVQRFTNRITRQIDPPRPLLRPSQIHEDMNIAGMNRRDRFQNAPSFPASVQNSQTLALQVQ